jgi:hypothetical protein
MRAKAHGSRQQFMQQPKVLSPKRRGSEGNTGDVAARPVEAGDEAELNRAPPFAKTKVFRSGGLPVSVCLAYLGPHAAASAYPAGRVRPALPIDERQNENAPRR